MSAPLCVIGDFAWDVLIRTNTKLLTGGDTFGEVMLDAWRQCRERRRVGQPLRAANRVHRQDRP